MTSKRSEIWNYFKQIEDSKVRCNLCHLDIGHRGGSTSALWKHLNNRHTYITAGKGSGSSGQSQYTQSAAAAPPQPTISGMFTKSNITPMRCEKITFLIAKMIARDTLPINFVDGEGFKELMAYVEPAYVVPCAKTMKKRLQSMYSAAKDKVRANLADIQSVVLTTDCWTSTANDSYISLSAHYITSSLKMITTTLATEHFADRHTGENIKNKIESVMANWDIEDKTTAIVHDNAANMNLASSLSDKWRPIPCTAHTLQLAVNHALDKSGVNAVVSSACRLVSHFRHSTVATTALHKEQERMNLPQKKLMLYCKTRWNSAYDMLLRLKENRWVVSAVLSDPRTTKPSQAKSLELSNEQWHIINSICPVLEPLKLATVMLSSEENVTVSVVLPIIAGLLAGINVDEERDDHQTVVDFQTELVHQLNNRFSVNGRATMLHLATFLDPRFNHMNFLSSGTQHWSLIKCTTSWIWSLSPLQVLPPALNPTTSCTELNLEHLIIHIVSKPLISPSVTVIYT